MAEFDWRLYLTLAEEMYERRDEEACARSAISRAYYSCYCRAHRWAEAKDLGVQVAGDSHKALWDAFRNSRVPSHRSLGGEGDRLRRARLRADYHGEIPNLLAEAWKAMTVARKVSRLLDEIG